MPNNVAHFERRLLKGNLMAAQRGVILLDRDGTINVDLGYVVRPSGIVLIPGAARAIGSLKEAGWPVFVVSNQSAVGRGFCTEADVIETNYYLQALLVGEDPSARLDGFLFCPHRPEEACACRKPKTGLLAQLPATLNYSVENSWVIGDKLSDIGFGRALGCAPEHCILVATGSGEAEHRRAIKQVESGSDAKTSVIPQPYVASIVEAAERILVAAA